MSYDVKKFINSIGAIAQIAGLLYTDLTHEGFSEEQAFDISKEFVISGLTGKGKQTDEQSH